MTRPLNTTTHAWAEMQRAAHHRRVQEWRQSRPVVARVWKLREGPAVGQWCTTLSGDGCLSVTHGEAMAAALDWVAERGDGLHEWRCPNCDATTRARMADR